MIVKYGTAKTSQPFNGVVRRVLAHSDIVMLTEHILEKGAVLPDHNHPQEQLTYILQGEIVIEINGERTTVAAGDSLVIPANIKHKVIANTKTVALDIFTPSRPDYL
jgi:quercetin dioxygenase-like cupin family protein